VRLTRENRWERCQRERMLVPSRTVMECRSRRGPTPNVAASHWRCCGTYGDKAKPPGRTGAFSFPPGPTALTISFLGVATSFRATRQSRWFSGMTGGFAVRSALREYTALVGPFPAGPTAPDDVKWTPHRQGDEAKPPVVNPPDGFAASPQMTTRRFPPPWSVADSTRKSGRGASKSVCLSAVGPRSTAPGEEVRHPTLPCAPRCIPHAARRGTRQSRRS
jgi:hypothetical protein